MKKFSRGTLERFELSEERTSELKKRSINTTYSRNTRKKIMKKNKILTDLWDII